MIAQGPQKRAASQIVDSHAAAGDRTLISSLRSGIDGIEQSVGSS